MGAHPDRSEGHPDQQKSHGADTISETATRTAMPVDGASGLSTHVIEPITMRVPDACRYIGISRSTLYLMIAAGEIEIIKLGCSTLVLTESLKTLVASRRGIVTMSAVRNGA